MTPESLLRPRPAQAALAAMLALALAAVIAGERGAPARAPAPSVSCWSAAPSELSPLACGEHGALVGIAGD
jgi:hypothetical protein